jgi:hypothetical protein
MMAIIAAAESSAARQSIEPATGRSGAMPSHSTVRTSRNTT